MRHLFLALALLALPGSAVASGPPLFLGGNNVVLATSTFANVYAAGGTITVTTPTKGDLMLFGGSLSVDAPVTGDVLLVGGSLRLVAPVLGDMRIAGGHVSLNAPMSGDLVAIGGSVTDAGGGASSVFIIAGETTLSKGAKGHVTIYGNAITLGGTFTESVEIIAGDHLTLLSDTVIHGELRYQAPQQASIPTSASVIGGVHYTGTSYLPTKEEARAIAFASFGVFLFVKILGSLILAGLVAGLLPSFVDHVVARSAHLPIRRAFLTLLLGFGVLVAVPVLLVILSITFVGLGLAFILGLAYLLLIPIAFIYGAIVCGAYLAEYLFKRTKLRWSDAVFGMLALFLIWELPYVGGYLVALATMYMVGVLTVLIYRFAFPRDTELA